ncbi:hypothetical protein [Viridibacillus arvi]|uniref:hypothetical protein n=1 Tax=Viridibacillus arvi TaxID=263475 RepID=UPI00187B627A|nr:hypothetical protein [Viridibacillus sp. JNUCC-6]QOV10211.1 hypothetical protein JNUCC6_16690 [Viridibacillus sp. JNUCC-6]
MMKKYSLFYIFSIVIGLFILNGLFMWLNIPMYDQLLEMILGEPNTLNKVIAITISGVLIYWIIKGVPKLKKSH